MVDDLEVGVVEVLLEVAKTVVTASCKLTPPVHNLFLVALIAEPRHERGNCREGLVLDALGDLVPVFADVGGGRLLVELLERAERLLAKRPLAADRTDLREPREKEGAKVLLR